MYQTAGSAASLAQDMAILRRYVQVEPREPWGPCAHFAAVQPALGRPVSIRVLPADALGWDAALARFSTAARVLGRAHHANVLQIYDLELEPGLGCAVVTEPLVGRRLDRVLADRQSLAPSDATQVVRELARGMLALQRTGVACGLLDPADVAVCGGPLVDQPRRGTSWVKVMGLGGEAPLWLGEDGLLRLYGAAPPYAAPELATGHPPDARSDVFALGSLLFELLSGRKPFPGEDATLRDLAPGSPERPGSPRATASLLRLVAHSLREAPADRYPSVEAFLERLDAAEANWSFSSAVMETVRGQVRRH